MIWKKYPAATGLVSVLLAVGLFWTLVFKTSTITTPRYHGNEFAVLENTNIQNMWQWKDYGEGRFRFSPFGLILIHEFESKILKPFLPAELFTDPASRPHMKYVYVGFFILIAGCVFTLVYNLFQNLGSAVLAGAFIGVNKGLFGFFFYMSTFAALFLVLFACFNFYFVQRMLKADRVSYRVGFYATLILCMGTWEHWLNLIPVFLCLGLLVWKVEKKFGQKLIHLCVVPLVLALIYVALRAPMTTSEAAQVGEAQFVFNYPSIALMIEDMVTNISFHLLNVFDGLLIPWPTLSYSVTHNLNMTELNAYNAVYSKYPSVQYIGFKLWYAGLFLGLFLWFSKWFLQYRVKAASDRVEGGWIGYLLLIFGFLIHIPIMHRTYFLTPGFFIGYKHMLSILGFAILIGWLWQEKRNWIKWPWLDYSLPLVLIWLGYCNFVSIQAATITSFPW